MEKGFDIDEDGFNTAMENQRKMAREARKTTNYMGADVTVYQSIDTSITSKFVGYDKNSCDSKITVLTTDTRCSRGTDGRSGRYDPHGGDSFLCDHAADRLRIPV